MQAPKFPCTIHELPKELNAFLLYDSSKVLRVGYFYIKEKVFYLIKRLCEHPFEETLFPKNLLVSPEHKHLIKEDLNKTCAYLNKWKYEMWQENERMLAGVPSDFRQNALISFREKEAQYNKQYEEYINLAKSVFTTEDLPWTDEVKEYVAKKEVEQKAWWQAFLSCNYKKCKNCKHFNERVNNNCVGCGSSFAPPHCGKCKTLSNTGDKYCSKCGNKLPLASVQEAR